MAKGDAPPLLMKIKDGRMEPVAQFDYERLCSYRIDRDDQGNIIYPQVKVFITQEAATWRRRKYWAILQRIIDAGATEYRSPEDLHKAVKREIGFVNSTFLSDGKTLKVTLKSTAKLDEQEFRIFYEEAIEALSEMTGVDVETLHKESSDVGRDETEQPEEQAPPPASGSGSSEAGTEPSPAAADQPASAADPSLEEEDASQGSTSGDDNYRRLLKLECVDSFIGIATRGDTSIEAKRKQMADTLRAWRNEPVPPDFIEKCRDAAGRIVKKESTVEREREYLGRFTQ